MTKKRSCSQTDERSRSKQAMRGGWRVALQGSRNNQSSTQVCSGPVDCERALARSAPESLPEYMH
ncbi:hypothetical protein IF1G_05830 [Cordyceps javanica]|uniref:Uncharacterized protein n=1 Tax=Cordyceps javanica TaxID=43265 RepID=A0A545V2R3_9HYPO|nr:hypothetical protein IF1G_05830 [Cordyceps javanica]TQW06797.1 hypothetical protein IF2G_05181 [Cordyceps javanica]